MSRYELLQKFWVVNFFTKKLVLSIEKKSIIFACKFNLFSSYKLQFILSETIKQNLLTLSIRSVVELYRKISYFYQKQLHNFELKWNEMSRYELLQKFWVVNFFTKKLVLSIEKKKHQNKMKCQGMSSSKNFELSIFSPKIWYFL